MELCSVSLALKFIGSRRRSVRLAESRGSRRGTRSRRRLNFGNLQGKNFIHSFAFHISAISFFTWLRVRGEAGAVARRRPGETRVAWRFRRWTWIRKKNYTNEARNVVLAWLHVSWKLLSRWGRFSRFMVSARVASRGGNLFLITNVNVIAKRLKIIF